LDVSPAAAWSSDNPAAVSVSNDPATKGQVRGEDLGSANITAAYVGQMGSTGVFTSAGVLQGIEGTPSPQAQVAAGFNQQFRATGVYSDTTTDDLTNQVSWSSQDPAIATISDQLAAKGLAQALTPGTATIKATLGDLSGSSSLVVTNATLTSIEVSGAT